MKKLTKKYLLIVATLLFGVITCIHPVYPTEQFLQHLGTLALLFIPIYDLRQNKLSLTAYACVIAFTFVHIIGARYLYSYVPYNDWVKSLFNVNLSSVFHTSRNHYDRFVHFSFGVLFFPYLYELLDRKKVLSIAMKIIIVWAFIQTASMIYELFEWALTLVLSSQAANDYNGQQGDMWDAQKDMALAMFGSTILAMIYWIKDRKTNHN